MDFSLLINRRIIDILIGDVKVYGDYALPYMSGPDLCQLCTTFGLPKKYVWSGGNQSRWEYMQELLSKLHPEGRISDLLLYLFQLSRFDKLTSLANPQKVKDTYNAIIANSLKSINAQLLIAGKELRLVNNKFVMSEIGEEITFEAPKVKIINSQYIRELPERIKGDIDNTDYDSVITKSRTLLEEVLIYIIERRTFERYKSNGDLNKIYQDATELLNMRQRSEWDKRVNEMLGGLHKLVSAISSMRNMNSDAHGAGSGRISIKQREALLVANSAMIMSEYWLSVFENKE